MKTVKTLILLVAFGLFTGHAIGGGYAFGGDPLEQWEHNNPDASKALGEWVRGHKEAAKYIFQWDADHPERSQELVNWAVANKSERLGKFHRQHKDWPELDEIESHHKPAMEDFLKWCRDYSTAASALMEHPGGLSWASEHLWKESKRMEKE